MLTMPIFAGPGAGADAAGELWASAKVETTMLSPRLRVSFLIFEVTDILACSFRFLNLLQLADCRLKVTVWALWALPPAYWPPFRSLPASPRRRSEHCTRPPAAW